MKKFDVYGIGNAIMDILIDVSDAEFAALGFQRGTMTLVDTQEQSTLLKRFESRDAALVAGGSVANSIIAISQLGGRSAFGCCIGDDRYGLRYDQEFRSLGVKLSSAPLVNASTGTCLILVEPHGERTMRTSLGISAHLSEQNVDGEVVANSQWAFIEGYILANGASGNGAAQRAISAARAAKTQVALTFSDTFVVNLFRDRLNEIIPYVDLLFSNESEALAFTGESSAEAAFAKLTQLVPNVAMTCGARGAMIRYRGKDCHVPASQCTPKDLTGAGDMFAGAFLYGICNGHSAEMSARGACYLASKVISQVGARLQTGVPEHWNTVVPNATHA